MENRVNREILKRREKSRCFVYFAWFAVQEKFLGRNHAVGLGSAGNAQSGQPIICSNLLARRLRRPAEGIGRAQKVHRKVSRFAAGGPVGETPTGGDREARTNYWADAFAWALRAGRAPNFNWIVTA
jgi:hypothetical protein